MNNSENQGHRVYFGDGWHYTVEHIGRWPDAPRGTHWRESRLTLHPYPVEGSHSVSPEMMTSVVALAQAGNAGVLPEPALVAWAFVNDLDLKFFTSGGIPRMRLADWHLGIAFAEPERQAMAEVVSVPKRKRRRLVA